MASSCAALALLAAALLTSLPAGAAGGPGEQARGSCGPGQISVKVSTEGAAGTLFGIAHVRPEGGSACRLRGHMRFAVKRRNGRLLDAVRGNPGRARFHRAPGESFKAAWGWSDWCGRGRHFSFVATVKGARDALRIGPPPCLSDGAEPSRLRRARG